MVSETASIMTAMIMVVMIIMILAFRDIVLIFLVCAVVLLRVVMALGFIF